MNAPGTVAVRVATWPPPDLGHPYVDLLYDALAPHGVRRVPDVTVPAPGPPAGRPAVDVWHLHWADTFWRAKGDTFVRQALRIARLRALLRQLRSAGVRVVWTSGDSRDGEIGAADHMGFRMLYELADLRIFTSQSARLDAAARYGDGDDSIVMPLGPHPTLPDAASRAEIRRALGVPPACRALLCFGDLRASNGFDLALAALDHLPRGVYRLLIAGCPVTPFGTTLTRTAGSRRGVHLVASHLDAQHLSDLLCASDLVLFPARSVTESSRALQALSYGRALVTTDRPYFRELLGGTSEASAFAPPDDAQGLARAIERLLTVPFERRNEAARAVADRHSWTRTATSFVDWLQRQRWPGSGLAERVTEDARQPRASGRAASSVPASR